MRADLADRLRRTLRGQSIAEGGVTGVAGVTAPIRLRQNIQELRRLRPLRLPNDNERERTKEGVILPVTSRDPTVVDAIEERAAIISETCPAPYLDTFARLNHLKPIAVSETEWALALDDAGQFLDAWGAEAATMEWAAGDLFDVPRDGRPGGLVWQMKGERVEALGADHVRLSDGRIVGNQQFRKAGK